MRKCSLNLFFKSLKTLVEGKIKVKNAAVHYFCCLALSVYVSSYLAVVIQVKLDILAISHQGHCLLLNAQLSANFHFLHYIAELSFK